MNAATISWSMIVTLLKTFKLLLNWKIASHAAVLTVGYVVICGTCKDEYIGETGGGKTKLRGRVRAYPQHIRQPQYQQLKVEGHLRVCGSGKFQMFPLLQMHSQDTNLRRSYETRFQQKFKKKLNKLWWETYARKTHTKPSIVKKLFIGYISFKNWCR